MHISQPVLAGTQPTPNQPTLPGLEPNVVARYKNFDRKLESPIEIRTDRPIDAPTFAAFEDALTAAREIMVADRRDARWGMFKRHQGRVDGIALLHDAKQQIQLVRTNQPVDTYKEPVPGQMFPGQNWTRVGVQEVIRETPRTLALVGADAFLDLRNGTPAEQTPFER